MIKTLDLHVQMTRPCPLGHRYSRGVVPFSLRDKKLPGSVGETYRLNDGQPLVTTESKFNPVGYKVYELFVL